MKGARCSGDIRQKALELYVNGVFQKEILRRLHIARSTLHYWRKKALVTLMGRGGWKLSRKTRLKMSGRKGSRHPNWKGDSLNRICSNCGKVFRKTHDRRVPKRGYWFCSHLCALKFQIGKNHPCWKGGPQRQSGNKRMRWAKKILSRDGYCCVSCGSFGPLEAHHIKPWVNFPDLRFELSNGIALCQKCHRKVHRKKVLREAKP